MTTIAAASLKEPAAQHAVALLGLGTATPGHIPQTDSARFTESLCCDTEKQAQFLHRVYEHSGVNSRGSVLVDEGDDLFQRSRAFFRPRTSIADRGPTMRDRMRLYEQYAPALAERAARAALADGQITPELVTHVIPVSCTGFFSPGLDVELIRRLSLRPAVTRVQVGFMGCHGAFNAISMARNIVHADANAVVLVCCVELCSLHLAYGFDPQKIVANALFADGAAAAVFGSAASSGSAGEPRVISSSTMLIPDSLDAMTWRIGDHGFEMTLSPRVPELVTTHIPQWIGTWLAKLGLDLPDIDMLAIHPGGPKVLSAVSQGLCLPDAMTGPSRDVLRLHGNMSSGTVLFVLQNLIASSAHGRCMALGFGPGLTAEAMLLEL